MHWLKRDRWKAGIALAGMLLLLVLLVWVPVSAAGANEGASGLATPVTTTVQATPTEDATTTALQKEQLTLQNDKLKNDNAWAWLSPVSTILGPLATIGTILVAILVARNNLLQWSKNREDERKKREDDQRIEREKRDEERFQKVVEGLGSERTEAKVGAAITLRTFLQPGYERFYRQAFDLAVAHLRLRKAEASAPEPPSSPDHALIIPKGPLRQEQQPPPPPASISLDSLSQALITVFKESFPLARSELKKTNAPFDPRLLDATNVRLDHAYLADADLVQAWLTLASLREADLSKAHLEEAHLEFAQFEGAFLYEAQLQGTNLGAAQLQGANLSLAQLQGAHLGFAQLQGANLGGAQLQGANLFHAQLEGVNFGGAQLEGAHLFHAQLEGANPEDAASLKDTKMNGATGLTPEQREMCIKKGAIFDDVQQAPASATNSSSSHSPAQSNDTQAPAAPSAQVNTPPSETGGNGAASSQQCSES